MQSNLYFIFLDFFYLLYISSFSILLFRNFPARCEWFETGDLGTVFGGFWPSFWAVLRRGFSSRVFGSALADFSIVFELIFYILYSMYIVNILNMFPIWNIIFIYSILLNLYIYYIYYIFSIWHFLYIYNIANMLYLFIIWNIFII